MAKKDKTNVDVIFPPIMPGEEKIKRIQYLQDSSDDIKPDFGYFHKFTDQELIDEKDLLAEVMEKLTDLQEEFDKVKEEFKEETKPLDRMIKATISSIKMKGRFIYGTVYVIKDFDNQLVGFYNDDGILVQHRKMLPDETQKTIKLKEAVNDNEPPI